VLIAANLVATVMRFVLFRHWVFGQRRGSGPQQGSRKRRDSGERPMPGTYPAISPVELATQGERNA
jgi:hypothetical protein